MLPTMGNAYDSSTHVPKPEMAMTFNSPPIPMFVKMSPKEMKDDIGVRGYEAF